jgi:DNA-binding NarL/FixJ family response regulator
MRALGAESYGLMLLGAGERQTGLDQLDEAWDHYDCMGAVARRAAVQRMMRQAGARRSKWSHGDSDSAHKPLTEAERRVVYLIADGYTDNRLPKRLAFR